jgi:hypothetical protein
MNDVRVCSVVVRWSRGRPVRILALRDELVGREFDDPAAWWPEFPGVVGGRDRVAGGTWCATRVDTGTTALVVNRPEKRVADPGAPSRGVLPLLGAMHGADWLSRVDLPGMASFALVLATAERLTAWDFDGADVTVLELPEGTSMITSGGEEDLRAERHLRSFTEAAFPEGWRELVQAQPPSDDPGALVVRHQHEGRVFATVFGQLADVRPGRLHLEYSREPWTTGAWTSFDAPGRRSGGDER